ncbi:MAG: phosphoribosylanthranilate isomerase, partial [Lachnospiraceae bacterium]|nr:phosphoribosylanthranilate isomerase [Lachnospiraceae bacterium]
MMVKIKICGIKRIEDVYYVNQYLPDYIGFVFADTRRKVSLETAALLAKELDPRIKRVGVYVRQEIGLLTESLVSGTVDYLQLHGDEDAAYEEALFESLIQQGIDDPQERCIKAFRIRGAEDFMRVGETKCRWLLLDTYSQTLPGGTGEHFNWDLIQGIDREFFLAGGINVGNIERAIREVKPYAVDVSSSLETDGVKDKEKIREFMEKVAKLR